MASEPLVFDPVDLEFDAGGRAFVLEMGGYPETKDSDRMGRIIQLLDRNRDGIYDGRRVFASGFRYADSILPYYGGLLVADAPEVLFVKDTTGDGRADLRQVLLSGFALGPSESNVNGLAYGPDGWVYAANGSSGGSVRLGSNEVATASGNGSAPEGAEPLSIRGLDVRFRFDRSEDGHRLTGGRLESAGPMGGGFGVTFDDAGRRFVTHEQRHIQVEIVPDRLFDSRLGRASNEEISDHGRGGQTRVYPVSDTTERPNHPEQAGYFTAGSGLTHYGGDAAPSLRGQFFTGETVHNLVHRDVIESQGAGFVARRLDERSEFLASRDLAFRPVNYTTGPDGALYVVDMQRDTIEHPEWIPDDMEQDLDLRAGSDRGRIYRVYEGSRPLPPIIRSMLTFDAFALIETLSLDNQWHRTTARRLLAELNDPGVPFLLRDLLEAKHTQTRLEALFALEGVQALKRVTPLGAAALLSDTDEIVRERAFLTFGGRLFEGPVLEQALLGALDPKPRVRLLAMLQLARAADQLEPRDDSRVARRELAALLSRVDAALISGAQGGADDAWLRRAAAEAAVRRPVPWTEALDDWPVPPSEQIDAHAELWFTLGQAWGRTGDSEALSAALVVGDVPARLPTEVGKGIASGLENRTKDDELKLSSRAKRRVAELAEHQNRELALLGWQLARELNIQPKDALDRSEVAWSSIGDASLSLDDRLTELRIYQLGADPAPPESAVLRLAQLLSASTPTALAEEATRLLTAESDPARSSLVATELIQRWPNLRPGERRLAGDFLVGRRAHHEALLDAIEAGQIQLGELRLDLERRRTLLRWSAPEIGARAAKLFSDSGVKTRREALDSFRPALVLSGETTKGREIFNEACSRCHALKDVSTGSVGPDLTDIHRKSAAGLLHDIIDPNANASPEYLTYDVLLASGDTVSGLLVETADTVVVTLATGETQTQVRDTVEEIRASGLSMMPEELEFEMTHQQMADLIAFLRERR